jgi:pimeloyl-ACP methyl ester carboxylesterase
MLDAAPYIDALVDEQGGYDPRPWLPDLSVPILYIHGRHDAAVPAEVAESLARLSPGKLDPVIIEGAGHLPHQQDHGAVARAIRDFARGPR